jgi:hypothetical protein
VTDKATFQSYAQQVKDLLSFTCEFPNMYLNTNRTNQEIKECYEKDLSVQQAANYITFGNY